MEEDPDGDAEAVPATHSKRDKREAKKAARNRDGAAFSKARYSRLCVRRVDSDRCPGHGRLLTGAEACFLLEHTVGGFTRARASCGAAEHAVPAVSAPL